MIFEWDDVLILGDSYCQERWELEKFDWPILFSNLLTGDKRPPRGIGGGGCSWWFTRKMLLKELAEKIPKVLVLCHTSKERIPNDHNYGINWGVIDNRMRVGINIESDIGADYAKVTDSSVAYYKYLYCADYHHWAYYHWYNELNDLLSTIKIPRVIHLNNFFPYTFDYGTTADILLKDTAPKFTWTTYHRNHYTTIQNKQLGYNLYRAVLNYNENDRLKNLNLFGDVDDVHLG